MTRARARLVVLVVTLFAGVVLFSVADVVDPSQLGGVRDGMRALGPLAPVVYVPLSAALGAALVPGPILAATSGLLFGPWLGTLVSVAGSVLSALIALPVGRRLGRDGVRDLLGARGGPLEAGVLRYGLLGVVGQRLLPGVPDAPLSYLAGALGVRAWQIGVGTGIGTLPRAFAYTAIGSSLDDPTSPLALAGAVAWVLTALVGVEVARRGLGSLRARRGRRDRPVRPGRPAAVPTPAPARERDCPPGAAGSTARGGRRGRSP